MLTPPLNYGPPHCSAKRLKRCWRGTPPWQCACWTPAQGGCTGGKTSWIAATYRPASWGRRVSATGAWHRFKGLQLAGAVSAARPSLPPALTPAVLATRCRRRDESWAAAEEEGLQDLAVLTASPSAGGVSVTQGGSGSGGGGGGSSGWQGQEASTGGRGLPAGCAPVPQYAPLQHRQQQQQPQWVPAGVHQHQAAAATAAYQAAMRQQFLAFQATQPQTGEGVLSLEGLPCTLSSMPSVLVADGSPAVLSTTTASMAAWGSQLAVQQHQGEAAVPMLGAAAAGASSVSPSTTSGETNGDARSASASGGLRPLQALPQQFPVLAAQMQRATGATVPALGLTPQQQQQSWGLGCDWI